MHGSFLVHGKWHAVLPSCSTVHPPLVEKHVDWTPLVVVSHGRNDICHRILRHTIPSTSNTTFSVRLYLQIAFSIFVWICFIIKTILPFPTKENNRSLFLGKHLQDWFQILIWVLSFTWGPTFDSSPTWSAFYSDTCSTERKEKKSRSLTWV